MTRLRIVFIICAIAIIVLETTIIIDYSNLFSTENLGSGLVISGMLLLIVSLVVSAKSKQQQTNK